MRGFLVISMVASLLLCGSANAADVNSSKTEGKKAPVTINGKPVEPNGDICYPEALTEQERGIGMGIPCEKPNYIHMPLTEVQQKTFKDKSGIWTDKEVRDSSLGEGAWIWEKTSKIGSVEITISMIAPGLCATPSLCPFRVRLRTSGSPKIIKGWPETEQACASGKYYFIRNDFKEIVACDERISLD